MDREELSKLMPAVSPSTSEGADLLLDLRELLLSDGHPGKCVRCFFGLIGDLEQAGALKPLRLWLEKHVEIEVLADGREIDVLPVQLNQDSDLDSFCHRAIRTLRLDRNFEQSEIKMGFRFRDRKVAA